MHIKHSGPVIKLSDRKYVLWHKTVSFRIKTNFIAASVFRMCRSYMSPNTLSSCRSLPWPAAVQSTLVVNRSLPILLSLHEPFLCHVIHKKKSKVLETYSLQLACAFLPSIWHKAKLLVPSHMIAHKVCPHLPLLFMQSLYCCGALQALK